MQYNHAAQGGGDNIFLVEKLQMKKYIKQWLRLALLKRHGTYATSKKKLAHIDKNISF